METLCLTPAQGGVEGYNFHMIEWVRRLIQPSIFEDEETTRAARVLNLFGWVTFTAVAVITLSRIVTGDWLSDSSKLFFPIILVLILAMQYMIRRGHVRLAGWVVIVAMGAAMTFQAAYSDGLRDITILAFSTLVLLAALLLGWRVGLLAGLLSVGVIWVFALQEYIGVRQYTIDPPLGYARDLTAVFVISSVLTYVLIQSLNRSLSNANLELRERLRAEEKLQLQARYLTALHETTFGLLNRLELNPLLESILNRTSELLETPHVGIDLILPDESGLRQELGIGEFAKWNKAVVQKGQGMVGHIWKEGASLVVEDYETYAARLNTASTSNFVAVAGVPLKSGQKVIGTLVVAYQDRNRKISREQVVVLERLAALASLAIDNAHLYEESQREIQERRIIEQDLRISEERFRKVFDNSQIAIAIVTLDEGIFLEANEAFWRISGLEPDMALGRTSVEMGTWDAPEERVAFVNELLQEGSLQDVEVKFSGLGTEKTALGYYELIDIRDRRCILCMFHDISEKRQVERALRESEERFRMVFHASPVAICITSLEEGILLDANDAYWNLTGYPSVSSLGKSVLELDLWASPEDRRVFVEKIKQNRSIVNPDYEFARFETNEPRNVIALYELVDIDNQPCILSMFYDQTKQKQAQDALRNAESRTRAILDAIPDMIFEVSRDGIFLDFMASAGLTTLMEPRDFIGENIRELFPEAIAQQSMFAIERAIDSGQVHSYEYGLPPGEEVQFFEARVAPVTSASAIIMVRDISQRRWVETEREKLIRELEDKNSELERFTYTVSHDLKSPIITIRGFLGFLEQDAQTGNLPRLRADVQRISDAADKMQTLLNELLELSRIGRLVNPPSIVPFNEIVDEAIALVQGRLQASHAQVRVQDGMESVHVDRQRTAEAVQNLIDNAAKFSNDSPVIEIGQAGAEGGMPVFFVHDNGIGIDLIHHERIFGLFNKLDADSEGTGIGLALVRRIVEVHKGRIWVRSEPGKGSTFFFTLPPAPPPDPIPES